MFECSENFNYLSWEYLALVSETNNVKFLLQKQTFTLQSMQVKFFDDIGNDLPKQYIYKIETLLMAQHSSF